LLNLIEEIPLQEALDMQTPSLCAALIIGASSGIGATYADRLAQRGHELVLGARDKQRMETIASHPGGDTGAAIDVMPADLTIQGDFTRIEARLREDPAIAFLVNNAGAAARGAPLRMACRKQRGAASRRILGGILAKKVACARENECPGQSIIGVEL
jgi:short-subunit dehydrogenase